MLDGFNGVGYRSGMDVMINIVGLHVYSRSDTIHRFGTASKCWGRGLRGFLLNRATEDYYLRFYVPPVSCLWLGQGISEGVGYLISCGFCV